MTRRLAGAVSGTGSNLRALHAAAARGELGGEIVLVVADRPCTALDWAAEHGIDTAFVRGGADAALAEALAGAPPDVLVLAGYMRIVGPRGLKDGTVEIKHRKTGERETLSTEAAVGRLKGLIVPQRRDSV